MEFVQLIEWLSHPVTWLVVAVVLVSIELIVPGAYFLWLGVAALIAALLALVFSSLGGATMLGLFALVAVLMIPLGSILYRKLLQQQTEQVPNAKAAQLVGRKVPVIQAIAGGSGRVKVDDGSWLAQGPDCDVGSLVLIEKVQGTQLIVRPVK